VGCLEEESGRVDVERLSGMLAGGARTCRTFGVEFGGSWRLMRTP
jgi:hypothetical protein